MTLSVLKWILWNLNVKKVLLFRVQQHSVIGKQRTSLTDRRKNSLLTLLILPGTLTLLLKLSELCVFWMVRFWFYVRLLVFK